MNSTLNIFRALGSLKSMVGEMNQKRLELGRITKTSCILILSGMSKSSIPDEILSRCLFEQQSDGGWVSIVDSMWNVYFLKLIDEQAHADRITAAMSYLHEHTNKEGLWGRSKRDMSRIPVSGMLLFLLPELATAERLMLLENLWFSEFKSLTYKAAYTMMAFRKNQYKPSRSGLIEDTINWIIANQRDDGGFAPWRDHPVRSDVFCAGVAVLGMIQYKELVPFSVLKNVHQWLITHQLPQGIWAFHEIEDGTSWGLWALNELHRYLEENK